MLLWTLIFMIVFNGITPCVIIDSGNVIGECLRVYVIDEQMMKS